MYGTFEQRDLHELAVVEEITSAVNRSLEGSVEARILVPRANSSGFRMATVTLLHKKQRHFWLKGI